MVNFSPSIPLSVLVGIILIDLILEIPPKSKKKNNEQSVLELGLSHKTSNSTPWLSSSSTLILDEGTLILINLLSYEPGFYRIIITGWFFFNNS